MDLFEESPDDRLIEDYLFSGYEPHDHVDQQFAKPIVDEDLFCVKDDDILPDAPIDDIFLDDYSESGDATNSENIRPTLEKSYSKPPDAPQPTAGQIKKKLLLERIKQQALARHFVKPEAEISPGPGVDGSIEFTLEHSKLVSDSSSKLIFNQLFNRSTKANDSSGSPKCDKMNWYAYKTNLRKKICAQKRKVWDSFQAPADAYDEEEELVGTESIQGSPKVAEEKDDSSDGQDKADSDDDESNSDAVEEDEVDDDASEGSKSQAPSEDEADISDADLDDEDQIRVHRDDKSEVDCDQQSESESEDEIVRGRVIEESDEDDDEDQDCDSDVDNDAGSVRKFIEDEVEVDEDLY